MNGEEPFCAADDFVRVLSQSLTEAAVVRQLELPASS